MFPREFGVGVTGISLDVTARGFQRFDFADPRGAVTLLRDYSLGDVSGLASRLLADGVGALVDLPENTLAFVVRIVHGQREVIGARDLIGNTPLFGTTAPHEPAFASDLNRLRELCPSIPRELDPMAVGEYLLFRYTSGPRLLHQGVQQPLAAHALVRTPDRARHLPYRDLRSTFAREPFESTAHAVQGVLDRSLAREMEFDRLGVMFSGGLDSCYLASAARRPDLRLYTLGFPEVGGTDLRAAVTEAHEMGLSLRTVHLDCQQFAMHLPGAIRNFGWPIDHPNFVGRDLLFRAAAEDGIARVLSGDGSDTIFGGAWYVSLAKAVTAKRMLPSFLRWLPGFNHRTIRLAEVLRTPIEELVLFDKTYYSRELATRLSAFPGDPMEHLRLARREVHDWDPIDQAFYMAYLTTLSVYPSAQRGMAWARGVDVGYPFLSDELVRLANSVAGREKVRGFVPKRLFMPAARAVLPTRILNRPKYGLPVPLADFVTSPGGLLRYADLLRASDAAISSVVTRDVMSGILDRLGACAHTRDDLELYWVLLNLEIWSRQSLRGEHIA